MDRLLSISLAARLAGVSRKQLQQKIQDGELLSFEGKLRLDDLITAFPQTQIEDTDMVEKIEAIIENTLHYTSGIKLQKLPAPDLGTLASRVYFLSKELASSHTEQNRLKNLIREVLSRLDNIHTTNDSKAALVSLQRWLEKAVDTPATEEINPQTQLLAKEAILQLVTAQVHIIPSGHEFLVEGNNSILEAGLNAGLALNYGCSNGKCGKCKTRLISGEVRQTQKHEYIFSADETKHACILSCCNTAVTDIVLLAQEAFDDTDIPQQEIDAQISKLEKPDKQLAILTVRTPLSSRLRFLSGQSVYLSAEGTGEALYPIANCPCDDRNLQFHIPRTQSMFSNYVFNTLSREDRVHIRGPQGSFLLHNNTRPLLFLAFDYGFAPVKALIEQAISLDKVDRIHLYRFSSSRNKPCLDNLCRAWNDSIDIFRYSPLTLTDRFAAAEDMFAPLIKDYHDLQEFDIYLAGDSRMLEHADLFLDAQQHPPLQRFSFNTEDE